jgi:UDP-2,3-diacylglucosamine pyrophosphatase LpxH
MTPEAPLSTPTMGPEESIIVVSDIHLGGKGAHHDKFCEFLTWIKGFPQRSLKIRCKEGGDIQSRELNIEFTPLTKLILLGDIVDLWDPEDQDRNNVISNSLKPLSILHTLQCDKIYVTGNHDDDVGDMFQNKKNFSWGEGSHFRIYPRHYPEPIESGLSVDKTRYTFLHGHQFDGEQIPYIISEIVEEPFDPIDTLTDLANMSVSKILKIPSDFLIAGLWVVFLVMMYGKFLYQDFIENVAVAILSTIVALALLRCYPKAEEILGDRKPRWWERALIKGIFLVPSIALIAYCAAFVTLRGSIPSLATLLLPLFTAILTIFTVVIVLPRLIGFVQRSVYNVFKSRDKTVEEVLKDGFVEDRDTLMAEVIIFGHTHRAGYMFKKFERKSTASGQSSSKLFVNTGCWVDTEDERPVDTFVYLDKTGLYLLEWEGAQKINCLFHAPPAVLQAITI